MSDDVATRLELLETERELTRLVYNYCHGIDRRDINLFLSIWHDDAVYDTNSPFGTYTGTAEIEQGVTGKMWPTFKYGNHWTHNFVVELAGDEAKGLSNFSFQGVLTDGTAIVVSGTYHDEFVRRNDTWRISRRFIETFHFAPLPGISFTPLPSA